ncbi:hypothetical protein BT96DRAFT_927065 [Gymnopus androsaceus JB14]|uniref:Luciferase domain-containing protein n=1 Tax=Gymnopus androsaceus JB14 TaxID=1447944 RepID=A0A6A4GRW2_9AGAR|nr:hypothetical protein BT96DRAFT_927065 [Gymnopus androsaceus JB14]
MATSNALNKLTGSLSNSTHLLFLWLPASRSLFSIGFRRNYLEWLAMGKGGLPANVIGWTMNWFMYLFSKEQLSTAPYDDLVVLANSGLLAQTRFIHGELPQRKGTRPVVAPFIAPQRQYPIQIDERIVKLEEATVESIVAANSNILCIQTSKLERRGPAIFLQPHITVQPWSKATNGELAHFHLTSEGSGHVLLSAADAKEVISKGWGQRHGLSGAGVPASYVLLYAPRDEEEVKIAGEIFKAAARCVSNGMEIV